MAANEEELARPVVLERVYQETREEGIFPVEWTGMAPGRVAPLGELGQRLGREFDAGVLRELSMSDCLELGLLPVVDEDRVEACRKADAKLKAFAAKQRAGQRPNPLPQLRESVLDGRYDIDVRRMSADLGCLVIMDRQRDEDVLSQEPVTLSDGARFGPDSDDIARRQAIATARVGEHGKEGRQ